MISDIKIKKINKRDTEDINQVACILYNWWGKDGGLKISDLENIVKSRCGGKTIPITYIAKIDGLVVGTLSFLDNDTQLRKDLYPMLGCLYVKEKYRKQNVATRLMNAMLNDISKNFNCVFLTTPLDNFYEQFGFEFVEITDVNMVNGVPTREKLYKKDFNC